MNAHAVRCGLFLIWVAWVFGDTSEFQIKDCLHLFFMPLRKQQNNMSMRKIVLKHKVLPKQQPLLQKALLTATFAMLSSGLYAKVQTWIWWCNPNFLIVKGVWLLFYLPIAKEKVKMKWNSFPLAINSCYCGLHINI